VHFAPLTPDLAGLLAQQHLQQPFADLLVDDLAAVVEHARLEPGEVLIRQDEPDADLFLILRGRVRVHVEHPDREPTILEEIGAGGVTGEMALLTGQRRSATVVAIAPTDVARLGRADFERLAASHPRALQQFLERILPRLQRNQLVRMLTELFGEMDAAALAAIEQHLDWIQLPGGRELFHAGDSGDEVFIVINGRLRVVIDDGKGAERVLEEVGRCGAVGELALLTGEPRAATVYAVRDTDLLRLTRAAFDRLLDHHPRAMMQIARSAAWRLRREAKGVSRTGTTPTVFAVIAASGDVPRAEFTQRLAATLAATGATLRLTSDDVDRLLANPGVAQSGHDSVVHASLVAWMGGLERSHRFVVLQADPTMTAWTQRCLRQADRVLVVARADGDPACTPIEKAVAEVAPKARVELVLLHANATTRPAGTPAWLASRRVAAHHHVRLGRDEDLRRLARRVTGKPLGVVLGGGGARGFVHIGVLRALGEAGIEIDAIGGTSFGAMIAAAHAHGYQVAELIELARTFASPGKLLDRTLPIVALMRGRKVTLLFRHLFGDVLAEDLWIPFFAISSDLTRAQAVVHSSGALWHAVRASTALPAVFPPLLDGNIGVLVDGGVMNNMPLDVMRTLCESGIVIGVNPMPTHDRPRQYVFGPHVSGIEALLGRLGLFGVRTRTPSILGSVMRATEINSANRMRQPIYRNLADVLIEPPVEKIPILAFDQYAAIIDIGYRAAVDAIAAWQRASTAGTAA
jgi:NTE family protein/lysophospholipid hydrolase